MPAAQLKYYKQLDGLRGIAALMVFYYHLPLGLSINAMHRVALFGQSGVKLFFVLSGFLITRILLAAKGEKHYYRNFYIRRMLRIFPLYYMGLAIYLVTRPVTTGTPIPGFGLHGWYWFYLQNFALSFNWPQDGPVHFWSLAVEEHFYLVWPVAVAMTTTNSLQKIACGLLATGIICRGLFLHNIVVANFFTLCCTDALAMGGILAIMEHRGLHIKYRQWNRYLLPATTVAIAVLWLFPYNNPVSNNLRPILLYLLYFSLIWHFITAKENAWLPRLCCTKVMVYTGLISYGIYVYHPLCNILVSRQLTAMPTVLKFLASLCGTYLLATASYFLYERYFISLKTKFTATGKHVKKAEDAITVTRNL